MTTIYHYTPAKMPPNRLKSMFVSRGGKLVYDQITGDLKKRAKKSSNQHYLILGPRGIGKSHLMGMLYYEMKGNPEIASNWAPLWFSEEEYSVISLRDLTERILEEITLELNEIPGEIHSLLSEFKTEMEHHDDDNEVFELAAGFIMDLSNKLQKRFVVIIENFNIFLNAITSGEEKRLRSELMTETSLLFIATSTTFHSYLKEVADPQNALYNLFDVHYLDEFTLEECRELILRQCIKDKNLKLKKLIEQDEHKLKLIHRIAGGTPRLMLLFYEIAGSLNNLPEVETAFAELLDRLTPYFQSRTDHLPPQLRKILITYAKSRVNLTPADVAKKIHLPTNQVTSQIKRLVEYGFLKIVEKEGEKKGTYYELTERIYRYWHQFRTDRGKKFITGLVEFIAQWFSIEQLSRFKENWVNQIKCDREQENVDCIMKKLDYIRKGLKVKKQDYSQKFAHNLRHFYSKEGDYLGDDERLKEFSKSLDLLLEIDPENIAIYKIKGQISFLIGDFQEANRCYKNVIEYEPNNFDAFFKSSACEFKAGNRKKARFYTDEWLKILSRNEVENFPFWIIWYIFILLSKDEYDLADIVIIIIEGKNEELKIKDLERFKPGFLKYLAILVQFYKTRDKNILDRQPYEIRETIKEIVELIKKKSRSLEYWELKNDLHNFWDKFQIVGQPLIPGEQERDHNENDD